MGFGHEGGALMGGVSALVKEAPESPIHYAEATARSLQPGRRALCGLAGTLASRTTREKLLLLAASSLVFCCSSLKCRD